MSHNTSAQGAPVTSQEAEAREAVLKAYDDSGQSPTFETDEAYDSAFFAALDAYAAAIRSSERERYAALVEAVIWMSGADDFAPGKPAHAHWIEIRDGVLASALAALEEVESV